MIRTYAAWFLVVVVLMVAQLFSLPAQAALSPYVNYQGKLADGGGTPVADGLYNMEFKLYNDPVAGSAVWTETRTGADKVQVTDGLFSILLGEVAAIDGVNFNQPLYLSVQIGGVGTPSWDGEMTPRRDISSVPTALLAGTALALDATNATSTNATTTNLYVGGALGVGTSTPITSMLAIKGDAAKANIFEIASSTNANIFMVTGTGRVGIGTSSPYAHLSVAGDIALTGGLYDSGASLGSNGMVLLSTGTGIDWVATSTLGITGGAGSADSLQVAYDTGATIETSGATSSVIITETTAAANTHDLLQLTANPATGGTFSGDALQITLDGVDADSNTGNGLHMVVDQSQITGYPILIEDDAGVDLFKVAENGALTVGSDAARADIEVYGNLIKKGYTASTSFPLITSIFVYDTSRDSDAGAWTNHIMAQGKSWYTETKDDAIGDPCIPTTDDRCGSSAFPKKAVIIATQSDVYIFDAQTNTMWMRFTQTGGTYALGIDGSNQPSSVFALNGVLYVGTYSTGSGLYAFDFINDRLYNYDTIDRTQGDKNIANRNTPVSYATDPITALALPDNAVNDVHGAVLSGINVNATANTALPGGVFIAAATDSGAAVINMSSGKVVRFAGTTITNDVNQVWVTKRGRLYVANEALQQLEVYYDFESAVANDTAPNDIWDETAANLPNLASTTPTLSTNADALWVLERESYAEAASLTPGDVIYIGHSRGLTEIHDLVAPSATAIGWSKFYTVDGVSPYMTGTPRGYFSFNETTGDLVDKSIRGSILEAEDPPTYNVDGVFGTGLSFNGTSDYLCSDANNDGTCDTDADFNVAALSFHVSLWFRHAAGNPVTTNDVLVDKRYTALNGTEGIGYRIEMNTSGQVVFGIQDTAATAGYDDSVTSTLGFADGQWHHALAVNTDTGLCLYIDGKLSVTCDTSLTATGTLDASQPLFIGADGGGAAGADFWLGEIDEVYFAAAAGTTDSNLVQPQARRLYLAGRGALTRRAVRQDNADIFSASTIGTSTATWAINQFAGSIVEITGGTGAGQTRRVTTNSSTTLSVSPNWTSTPDATSDFEINPEQLYGATNNVTSVAVTENAFTGKMRQLYIGASNGSDGGGATVFQGYGNAYVTDVYHSDAGKTTSVGTAWSGTDADDVIAIGAMNGTFAIGTLQHVWIEKVDQDLEQSYDYLANNINGIMSELFIDGVSALTPEGGFLGGADLAEYYSSQETLTPGTIVGLDPTIPNGVKATTVPYQRNLIGVVATYPGIILGPQTENTHPVALVGRVPVNVTLENGAIKAGDRITPSSRAGYGMRATQAGRVLGIAMEDFVPEKRVDCPDAEEGTRQCGQVMVFVNLVDYSGMSVSLLAQETETTVTSETIPATCIDADGATTTPTSEGMCAEGETFMPSHELFAEVPEAGPYEWLDGLEVLSFLKEGGGEGLDSEVFTGRLSAANEIITPAIFTDALSVGSITSSSNDAVVALLLGSGGKFEIRSAQTDDATTTPLITFDDAGNAVFSGTISARAFVIGDASATSTGTSTDEASMTDRLARIEGLLSLSEMATSTATTSPDATEENVESFIADIEQQIAGALDALQAAVSRTFAVVTLYTQNMFASTITIIPNGRVIVPTGTDQITGTSRIPAGASSVDVDNSSVLATSKIFITALSLTEHPLIVTMRRPGVGFTVSMFAPAALDVYFDWLLVDTYPTDDSTTSVPGETVVQDEPLIEVPIDDEPLPDEPELETEPEPTLEEETEPVVDLPVQTGEPQQEPETVIEPPVGETELEIEAEPTPEPEPEQEVVEPEPAEEPTT